MSHRGAEPYAERTRWHGNIRGLDIGTMSCREARESCGCRCVLRQMDEPRNTGPDTS